MERREVDARLKYLLVVLFFLVSGGQYFYILHGGIFVSLFLLLSLFYHVRVHGTIKIQNNQFFWLTLLYISFNYFVINTGHEGNTFLPEMMLLCGAFLLLTSFTFLEFRKMCLNIGFYMAIVSILIFFLVESHFISPSYIEKGNISCYMLLCHNLGWNGLFGRLAGIYWEPGAYQVVLNLIILTYIKEIVESSISKSDLRKIIVLIIAILLTQSTAGYISLAVLLVYNGYKRLIGSGLKIKNIFTLIFLASCSYYILSSNAVQEKLAQEDRTGSSYEIRRADNLAMLLMISEKPVFGYGIDSKEKNIRNAQLDNLTSSNGILSMISTYGFTFFLLYFIFLYKGVKKLFDSRYAMFITMFFLVLNLFEVYWYFPLALIFHCNYLDNLYE